MIKLEELKKKIKERQQKNNGVALNGIKVNDQIGNAIKYKRNGEYDRSLAIYINLWKEYDVLLESQTLAGWAKTLACSGRHEEAIKKYEDVILRAKFENNQEKIKVYTNQLNKLKNRKKNFKEFYEFLKSISGTSSYKYMEEITYMPELEDIELEDNVEIDSIDAANYTINREIISETVQEIINRCRMKLKINELGSKLDIEKWLMIFNEKIWYPTDFKIIEKFGNKDLICKVENEDGRMEELNYALGESSVEDWNQFILEYNHILLNPDKFYKFVFQKNIGKTNKGNGYFTNRRFKGKLGVLKEYICPNGEVCFIKMEETEYSTKISYGILIVLAYALFKYEKNINFYNKVISALVINKPDILYNNILSLSLLEILKKIEIIHDKEFNELFEVWILEEGYNNNAGQEFLLNPKTREILKNSFENNKMSKDFFENLLTRQKDNDFALKAYSRSSSNPV